MSNQVIYDVPPDGVIDLVTRIVQNGLTFDCHYLENEKKYKIILTGGF